MGYRFTGFFASPALPRPDSLPEQVVWRSIEFPFQGVGVSLPRAAGYTDCPPHDEIAGLLTRVGLSGAQRWIYLFYECFGGGIDFVYGLGSRDGELFGPLEESSLDKVESVYMDLMAQFGISSSDALNFPPFERGFWGET